MVAHRVTLRASKKLTCSSTHRDRLSVQECGTVRSATVDLQPRMITDCVEASVSDYFETIQAIDDMRG